MNSFEITYAFLTSNLSLDDLAGNCNISKAELVKRIFGYIKQFPEGKLGVLANRKLKFVLTKDFLNYPGRREDFASEYGMRERDFVSLIKEVIEDTSIATSDRLAEKIFQKLTLYKIYTVASVPKRIVRIIGERYVYANEAFKQCSLASIYGIHNRSISMLLRRGIAEGIFSDDLANKVYAKVNKYPQSTTAKAYSAAFDKREAAKP